MIGWRVQRVIGTRSVALEVNARRRMIVATVLDFGGCLEKVRLQVYVYP